METTVEDAYKADKTLMLFTEECAAANNTTIVWSEASERDVDGQEAATNTFLFFLTEYNYVRGVVREEQID